MALSDKDPDKKPGGDGEDDFEIEIVEDAAATASDKPDDEAEDDDEDEVVQQADPENPDEPDDEEAERLKLGKRAEKRIRTLVQQKKEALEKLQELQGQLAEREAREVEAVSRNRESELRSVAEHSDRLVTSREQVLSALKAAREAGDFDAEVKASEALATIKMESIQLDQYKKRIEAQPAVKRPAPTNVAPQPTKRDREWALKNTWFGQDAAMTNAARMIDADLREEGVHPETDIEEYYREIDTRVRKLFPEKFKSTMSKTNSQQKVVRPNPIVSNKGGKKTVRLTQSQLAMSKRLGVEPTEYARQLLKIQAER